MNNIKWFWFAIGYECCFAYVIALIVNQFGNLFTGNMNGVGSVIGLIVAIILIAVMVYGVVRPYKNKEGSRLSK
jgi:ferrous iron transport protein B